MINPGPHLILMLLLSASCGGGGGGSSSGNESTGVTPPSNAQPYFFSSSSASSTSFSVVENNASAATIEVDDADSGDSLSLSIEGGDDAAAFQFDACNASRCTSNTLLFKEAPDFETPNDVSEDNVYEVTLGVFDGTLKVTQEVSITVTNAVEGRVVDAPISGASLCLDQDEDWECDVLPEDQACPAVWPPDDDCFTEPSGTSDAAGYYSIGEGQEFPDMQRRVLSIGGTDILTNKELPSLALIATVNSDASEAVAVTPLSTVISLASDPGATMVALGFPETVTPDQITGIDPWAIATGSSEASGDFASSSALAENIGVTITELESIANKVVTTSVQIANLLETANALVTDTTSAGLQTTTERAAIISKTVATELVEIIDAAIASAGNADLGETTVINGVLKETTKEIASLIVAEIEAKQTNGTLDLSDTNDASVAAILQIKETQEVIIQTGLDDGETAKIAAISDALAETNAFVGSQVATSGIAVLTTASSAGELAEIITNTSTLVGQLVAGEITTENFAASADINNQASSNDGFNDSVAQFTDSDGDGVFDADDVFPNNGSETVDSDGDGVGDNADVFPNDGSETLDSDGDGVGNNADAFPNDGSETLDSDGDGIGNNADPFPDNYAPSFISTASASTVEHETDVATLEIDDADSDDTLSMGISGGVDKELFELGVCNTIRCAAKQLTFKTAPDFEDPIDFDQDNNYEVVVSASDGKDTISQELNIRVTNYALIAEAKEKMRSLDFNTPSANPAENLCIVGLDVPISQKLFCEEVYSLLHNTLGGYPNYLHLIWNPDGTDADAKPVLDKLSSMLDGTLTASNLPGGCLSGHDEGERRTASSNFYSVCYHTSSFTANPFSNNENGDNEFHAAIKLSLAYTHEYFHHYQRAHALERGLDFQWDRNNPSTTVQAPPWWIEGASVAHQNIWFKKHFSRLSVFASSTWEEAGSRGIAGVADDGTYKEVRRALMGAPGNKAGNCAADWQMTELEDTYETWTSCPGKMLAAPYLAHITSWKTVWVDIPMDYYDLGFWGALKKYTGLTKEEFYSDFNEFIRAGDAEDDPPAGWAPTEADWISADFLNVNYERL